MPTSNSAHSDSEASSAKSNIPDSSETSQHSTLDSDAHYTSELAEPPTEKSTYSASHILQDDFLNSDTVKALISLRSENATTDTDESSSFASQETIFVVLHQDLTIHNVEILFASFQKLMSCASLQIDLSELHDIDSCGLQLLVLLQRQTTAAGLSWQVSKTHQRIEQLLDLYGLPQLSDSTLSSQLSSQISTEKITASASHQDADNHADKTETSSAVNQEQMA